MTMNALEAVRSQKLLVANERANLHQQLLALDQQIKNLLRTRPKRPRHTLEEIQKQIQDLEFKRSTTSMSLQEEKRMIKQMEKLQGETKLFTVFEELDVQLESLRLEQRTIRDKLSETQNEFSKHRSIEQQFEVAKRISDRKGGVEITPDMLTELSIQLNEDKVGIVVGRQGTALKRMEENYGVVIDIDKNNHKATIQGIQEDAEAARMAIAAINEEVNLEIQLTHAQAHMLKRNKRKYLKTIEDILEVQLHMNADGKSEKTPITKSEVEHALSPAGTLIIRGSPSKAQAASMMISQLASHHVVMPMPVEVIPALLGPGGETITALQDELSVGIELDRPNQQLSIFGSQAQVEAARTRVAQLVQEHAHVSIEIPLTASGVGASIIGKGGENVRKLEQETGAVVQVKSEPTARVVISAPPSKIHNAEAKVREFLALYEATHRKILFPDTHLQLLTFKHGHFQVLREAESPDVLIGFPRAPKDGEATYLSVRGESGDEVDRVSRWLQELVAALTTLQLEIDDPLAVSTLIGKSGKTITKLQEDSKCIINVRDNKHVNILGPSEAVQVAESKVREVLELHRNTNGKLFVLAESVGLLIGKGGANLKRIREKVGAALEVVKPRGYRPPARDDILVRAPERGLVLQPSPLAEVRVTVTSPENLEPSLTHVREAMKGHLVPDGFDGEVLCAHVAIPSRESCSLLLANRGQPLKRIESAHRVAVEIHQGEGRVSVHGADPVAVPRSSIESAATEIRALLMAGRQTEETLVLQGAAVGKLDDRELRGIQVETAAKIELDRSLGGSAVQAKLSGTVKAVAAAKEILLELMTGVQRDRVRVAPEHVEALMGPTGQRNLARVGLGTQSRITVDASFKCVRLSGPKQQLETAKDGVRQLLEHLFPGNYVAVPVPVLSIPTVIGKKGANAKRIQTAHQVSIDGLRAFGLIAISGTQGEQVLAAKEAVEQVVARWTSENRHVSIHPELIPAFIGKGGSGIKAIEKAHEGVHLDVDREGPHVRIRATKPEADLSPVELAVAAKLQELAAAAELEDVQFRRQLPARPKFKFVSADAPLDELDRPVGPVAGKTAPKAAVPRASAFGGVTESKAAQKNRRRRERKKQEAMAANPAAEVPAPPAPEPAPVRPAPEVPSTPAKALPALLPSFASPAAGVSSVVLGREPGPALVYAGSDAAPAANGFPVHSHSGVESAGIGFAMPVRNLGEMEEVPSLAGRGLPASNAFAQANEECADDIYNGSHPPALVSHQSFGSQSIPIRQAEPLNLWESLLPLPPPGFGEDQVDVAPELAMPSSMTGLDETKENETSLNAPYYVGSGGLTVRLS